jgi:hypothetical protein
VIGLKSMNIFKETNTTLFSEENGLLHKSLDKFSHLDIFILR